MLQDYGSHQASKTIAESSQRAFVAILKKASESVKFWYCNKNGHVQVDCCKHKREQKKKSGRGNDKTDKPMIAMLAKINPRRACWLNVSYTMYTVSGATAHMVQDNSLLNNEWVPMNTPVRTACMDIVRSNNKGGTNVRLFSGTETVKLDLVLHVLKVSQHLVSVSGLCDNGGAVAFTNYDCVVKKMEPVFVVGNRRGGLYSIGLQFQAADRSLIGPEKEEDVLD